MESVGYEMTDKDYKIANELCSDLLADLGVFDGASIMDIAKTAFIHFPNEVEVNGDAMEGISDNDEVVVLDYPKPNHKNIIPRDKIEWIRIEGYGGRKGDNYNGAYIMYVYLYLNKDKTAIDLDNIKFDYYPNRDTDDSVDSVLYMDCKKKGE